jgi:hypothetical protein
MRSMRTTGYQATNLGLAVEEAMVVACYIRRYLTSRGVGEQNASLAAER